MLALLVSVAHASVDPACAGLALPEDYDEQAQQDFLQNRAALAAALSPIHGPVPVAGGHGAIGLDLGVVPPVGCERRLVLNHTQTADVNGAPVQPRPRLVVAFPTVGRTTVYGGAAYLPPIRIGGRTNASVSGELGLGVELGSTLQLGARVHATLQKAVGEYVTPLTPGAPAYDELFVGSTFGADALVGASLGPVVPYVAVGVVDASTFFFVGDDALAVNNFHPYAGPAGSVGLDALAAGRLRLGAEVYAAPGGHSRPDPDAANVTPASRYGRFYTGKLRIAWEL